ncbi:hypothetical protein RRG08_060845 [Elysia crispata]|uniref:DNA-directed RNA polymerase III subunit RPC4 n=1 Tax=Elysia crispata TaxID=231223 RepID=A0AAE0ZFQ3_9GAST|nr:hypothetical protein RRG08_060845 [Elysia crispata]
MIIMASGGDSGSSKDIPRGLVNRTGTPLGRGSRLPSVRGQRDLTLGGYQRKVFTPNLSAKKKTPSSNETSKESPGEGSASGSRDKEGRAKGRGKGDRGRGRGRGRGEDKTIQLHSEFALGPMGGGSSSGWSRGSTGGGSGGGGGGGGEGRSGESSSVIKASMRQCDNYEDKALLDTLLRDDFVSDISAGEASMAPIRLPLNLNNMWMKREVKSEVKAEPMHYEEGQPEATEFPPRSSSMPRSASVRDILLGKSKSENGELLVLQFPDTLPGLPASVLGELRPGTLTSAAPASGEDELTQRLSACQLKDCPEGFMGKLRVRKSGKVELVLGENILEVLPGLPVNFHQELVSIRTEDSSGQMVALGSVDHKLVVTPDYNYLISQADSYR